MNVEVLCITEHKLNTPVIARNLLEKYVCTSIYCREKQGGGGAAIYISRKGPPKGDIEIFYDQLTKCLQKVSNNKNIFICGDLNIDIKTCDKNKLNMKKELEYFLAQQGFYTITDKYTRDMGYCKTAIDHIITNVDREEIKSDCNIEAGISDHTLQYVSFHKSKRNSGIKFKYQRVYPQTKIALFCNELENQSWSDMYEAKTINEKFNNFHKKFSELYENYFPLKKCKVNEKDKRWVTKGIEITSRNYRELCQKIKRNHDHGFEEYFKKYRSIYRKILNAAKTLATESEINNAKNTTKAIWTVINKQMGKPEIQHKNISIKLEDNTICTDPTRISEEFNKYYCNLAKNLQDDNKEKGTTFNETEFSMYLSKVSENDIILAIAKLKNKKCSGYDHVCDEIIKTCHQQLIKPLKHLVQASFDEGVFPELLKLSKVMPLYKKGEETETGNYRPVANITTFSKIFEIVMEKKLRDYLYRFNILSDTQYGFVKGKSTTDAIVDFIQKIYNSFDKKKLLTGIFFDMSKAFDLVDHKILLTKLSAYGIRGKVLKWMESYLSLRKQVVEISYSDGKVLRTYRSNSEIITCGVPQG
ncbi:uncharacterized protein LOC127751012 [Frankliniella occidentalis]|uniref:Uncharacterized protein LOC127751012 n=1 Tax=Frankliniella occidentalis TaxID=133901 RepID=A0A9C6X633_FRAOC|nr:uncharacterized protein LOC127751012 [Frankliniella occidentalis]